MTRERGLYKNGSRWWLRVRTHFGRAKAVSTGTQDLRLANKIARMVADLRDDVRHADWLDLVYAGDVTLPELYDHRQGGTLHVLRESLTVKRKRAADPDLRPFVDRWAEEHLAHLSLRPGVRAEYERQVRALIHPDTPFPVSRWTETAIRSVLNGLTHPLTGRPLTGSSKRRYVVAWRLFHRWARKRVPLPHNPFEDVGEWVPKNNPARSQWHSHEDARRCIEAMPDAESRAFLALLYGSGIELGAALAMRGRHVGQDRTIVAPGTKTSSRIDRTIIVDEWAWPIFRAHAASVGPAARLWSLDPAQKGDTLREAYYRVQAALGLIEEPSRSPRTGKPQWAAVKPHRLHDCRHSYAITRLLGLDGEPRQDIKYVAHQLGHADEQMVMKVYAKANVDQRLRLQELRARAQQAPVAIISAIAAGE
jgi:integrase